MPFPWQPGMRATASRLNEHLPIVAIKSASETRTSTTVTPDTDLAIALSPGSWLVHMFVSISSTTTTGSGIVVQWALTGAASMAGFRINHGVAVGTTDTASALIRGSVNGPTSNVTYGSGNGFGSVRESARINVGAGGGTIALAWGKTSAGATCQVGVDSWIEAWRYT